jgi:hypothetical protein
VAIGIVVSHFGSEFNRTTTNKRSLPLLLNQAHGEWTIRRKQGDATTDATHRGQHSKLQVIRVYVLSFLNVRVYFLSSRSSHVQVLSLPSFLNFLRTKVGDRVEHWRMKRKGIVLYITPDRLFMVIFFDDFYCYEYRRVAAFEFVE